MGPAAQSSSRTRPLIFMIAGEASGDVHGGALARALLARLPQVRLAGVGGDAMRSAGVKTCVDAKHLSAMGVTDVLMQWRVIFHARTVVKHALTASRPDLLILIDYPGFNLRAAAFATSLGIPVLYYISPKLWAWKPGRIEQMRAFVDHTALILPFEKEIYATAGVPATYVGNPLLDYRHEPLQAVDAPPGNRIGLLPGSRKSEVSRHLPVMLGAAAILHRSNPDLVFFLSIAPSLDRDWVADRLPAATDLLPVKLVTGGSDALFACSDLVVAASGTVTLEAAVAGMPTIIIYRMSAVSFMMARRFVKVPYAGLANLIAGREVMPELLQDDANPAAVARMIADLLASPERLVRMRTELADVRQQLGQPGVAARTADLALSLIR
ncbi:MAG: lipid-A-disaccharide synthase [Deltaproteobacteria bacterium]|nr:MAG: lipid-A-disaccharide synthase [Deltaproteobacteria bacterium]